MNLIPTLPLSLNELVEYYRVALRECDFLIKHLHGSLDLLEARMKPSALVSVQFNKYESYYVSFLDHLKWRLSDICVDPSLICVDPSLEFRRSKNGQKHIEALFKHKYTHSGIAHPMDEDEIGPMLQSLEFVRDSLDELIAAIEASMLKSIFLCHASADKPKVREIAKRLTEKGAQVWIDEAEILVGDSILEKIQEGIAKSDFLGIILSPRSVESIWVKKEVEAALTQEIESGAVKVVPILLEDCNIPLFLKPKKYADLSKKDRFERGISDLVKRLTR